MMKLRSIALAGVATLALSAPASASTYQGWYLGLGAGWDWADNVKIESGGSFVKARFHDDVLGVASVGYKWGDFRFEIEGGYDQRGVRKDLPGIDGGMSITSGMFNALYDIPLGDRFAISLGGGVGFGNVDPHIVQAGTGWLIHGSNTGFMWQGIAGVSFALDEGTELFADWRYRSAEVDHDFRSDLVLPAPPHINSVHENVALIGLRWYLDQPEAAPPPPAPPPPPPPPPEPAQVAPAVKTFIVFFDFDKSNLTEKAQEVVAEAVKTAKTSGMVRVVVTGHTDTVGSDTYNQALSERRAQAVKDEMVREGMDGSTIAIEGKSFHDPLVPTGPGVREPQNRRAVIDLGG
jgi:outer membrane protein OmpA-like peptidoglycan-associated protein/opacity protein-like surface antigen